MKRCLISLVAGVASIAAFAAKNITTSLVLAEDTDWSSEGTVTVSAGATVDLNGHTLKVKGLACNGRISDRAVIPGYATLSYIDVPNGCYIDTGFKPNQDTRVVMDVTVNEQSGGTPCREYWFGCWNNNYNSGAFAVFNEKKGYCSGYGNSGNIADSGISPGRHAIELDKGLVKVDGETLFNHSGQSAFQVNYNLFLFKQNRKGTAFSQADQVTIRFHSCEIYDNGTLVRNYVPVRNGDGVVGLYDLVSGELFANAGSGAFSEGDVEDAGKLSIDISDGDAYSVGGACEVAVSAESAMLGGDVDLRCFGDRLEFAGPVYLNGHQLSVAALSGSEGIANKEVYRRLSYIESTGTQWINTGFVTTSETAIEMDFSTLTDNGNNAYYCGDWANYGHLFVVKGTFSFYGTDSKFFDSDNKSCLFVANRHLKVQTIPGGSKTIVLYDGDTGTELGSNSAASLNHTGSGEMTIFAASSSGNYASSFRLHGFKLTHQGSVVRDFVPVERVADGKPGLYDLANEVFYPSASSSDFVQGDGTGEFYGLEDDGATGVFRVDVANGVRIVNDSARISGKVRFAKCGAGEYVERVAQGNFGGVALEGGTFRLDIDEPIVNGDLAFVGGTLAVEDGKPVTVTNGVSVSAPSGVLFMRGAKFGRRPAICGFGAGTSLAQLSLSVTPDPLCAVSLALDGDDLQAVLGGANDVVDAVWTGSEDSDIANPANWLCTNPYGAQIANGAPSSMTTVHIVGSVSLQAPANVDFAATEVSDCTLAADCDWSGLSSAEINGTVDLAGHSLVLSDTLGSGTITDTTLNRSSYIDVPNGYYIDTGFKPNQDTRVVMDVTVHEQQGGKPCREYWFGSWNGNYNSGAFTVYNEYVGYCSGYGNSGNIANSGISPGRHVIELDKGLVKVDGETLFNHSGQEDFQVDYNLFLFKQNRKGAAVSQADQVTIRFHSCQIYDNGTPVRDYVPSRNGAAFGLYEKVSGAFTSFSGTGASPVSGVVAGGELHIDTSTLTSVTNTTLAFTGSLTLVKDGTGTFTAAKSGQSYMGGTFVNGGWLISDAASEPCGMVQSLVTVADGAGFDWAGPISTTSTMYSFDIVGTGPGGAGAILLSNTSGAYNSYCLKDLTLSGDALVVTSCGTGHSGFIYGNPHTLALNGYTLTIDAGDKFSFRGVTAVDSGTIAFTTSKESGNRTANFWGLDNDLSLVTFDMGANCILNVDTAGKTHSVGTFIDRRTAAVGADVDLHVLDCFKPMTTNLLKTVVLGDATHLSPVLDLSALDGPFVLPSESPTLSATEGATVAVKIGAREESSRCPIITWDAEPANIDTITFVRGDEGRRYRIVMKDDGIYAYVRGFIILVE